MSAEKTLAVMLKESELVALMTWFDSGWCDEIDHQLSKGEADPDTVRKRKIAHDWLRRNAENMDIGNYIDPPRLEEVGL